MWDGQKIPKTQAQFVVNRTRLKPNLVTLKLLPLCTYTFATVVLPLLETPLEILFWYSSETCCHILLNFLYGSWGMTGQGRCEREILCTQMPHWQILFQTILRWFIQNVNNVRYLFHRHTPITHHDSLNFGHIFVTLWGCWPATLLIFWQFLATFKLAVPNTHAAHFFDTFISINHTKA
jgi:hypothetical protein